MVWRELGKLKAALTRKRGENSKFRASLPFQYENAFTTDDLFIIPHITCIDFQS
jgi:hypothetical protein